MKTLCEIMREAMLVEAKILYGEIEVEYNYDKLMSVMMPGHPAEILDYIIADTYWNATGGEKDPDSSYLKNLIRDISEYREFYNVKELDPVISDLKIYVSEKEKA